MTKIYVKVEGIADFERQVDRLKRDMLAELEKATKEAAGTIADSVRSAAPHESFKTAVSMKYLTRKVGYPAVTLVGLEWGKAPHQHLVEFGSGPRWLPNGKFVGSMPANPFFRWSVDRGRASVKSAIEQHAKNAIQRAGK
jgi:HK97 gp10 family phage protein